MTWICFVCIMFFYLVLMTHCKHLSNHNNHSLSTENNFTPNQLFIGGGIEQNMVPVCSQPPTSGSSQIPRLSDSVRVPWINFVPCSLLRARIETRVNPLEHCIDFGISSYLQMVHIVGRHLQTCAQCHSITI